MAGTLFFRMVFRKFLEITKNKPIFSQYNIFYNYEYFFFQSAFWSLFNHRQRSQSNQEQCSMCCSSLCFLVLLCTRYGPLQCFSTYFRKLEEIGVLRPVFPDYFISSKISKTKITPLANAKIYNLDQKIKNIQIKKPIEFVKILGIYFTNNLQETSNYNWLE